MSEHAAKARRPRLSPTEASAYLKDEHGLKVAVSTLAKLRTFGDGPSYFKPGHAILYDVAELDRWAEAKLGGVRRSTSEAVTTPAKPIPFERRH